MGQREPRKQIHLLLSPELDSKVRALAEEGHRPLVRQIEMLIERALELEQVSV